MDTFVGFIPVPDIIHALGNELEETTFIMYLTTLCNVVIDSNCRLLSFLVVAAAKIALYNSKALFLFTLIVVSNIMITARNSLFLIFTYSKDSVSLIGALYSYDSVYNSPLSGIAQFGYITRGR
jgi:hypothetical protein